MKLSGFTFMKNTDKLYYPVKESILSILEIIDEFVIALGDCDPDDQTLNLIQSIESNKIKVIHTIWDPIKFPSGSEYAHQTDLAKSHCSGDWLLYLQSDEVIHEKYLDTILKYCKFYLSDLRIDGFLFRYKHFFGDYDHYLNNKGWYDKEIRIVRNHPDIHSWGDAQSFKRIFPFIGNNYLIKDNTKKLNVIEIPADIYHYGWVRPPKHMQIKSKVMDKMYHDPLSIDKIYEQKSTHFNYGDLSKLDIFQETHPKVMFSFIQKMNWNSELHYNNKFKLNRELMKHEKWKYKLIARIEKLLLKNKRLFAYKNWNIVNSNSIPFPKD